MKTDPSRFTVRLTKTVLDILFALGIAAELSLPWSFRALGRFYPNLQEYFVPQLILFMLSGLGAIGILFELRRMFKTVLANNCFVRANVLSLRRMGVMSFSITLVTAARMLMLFTPATLLIVGVFSIAGLFSFVLAGVFDRAVSYKEENDLTI